MRVNLCIFAKIRHNVHQRAQNTQKGSTIFVIFVHFPAPTTVIELLKFGRAGVCLVF